MSVFLGATLSATSWFLKKQNENLVDPLVHLIPNPTPRSVCKNPVEAKKYENEMNPICSKSCIFVPSSKVHNLAYECPDNVSGSQSMENMASTWNLESIEWHTVMTSRYLRDRHKRKLFKDTELKDTKWVAPKAQKATVIRRKKKKKTHQDKCSTVLSHRLSSWGREKSRSQIFNVLRRRNASRLNGIVLSRHTDNGGCEHIFTQLSCLCLFWRVRVCILGTGWWRGWGNHLYSLSVRFSNCICFNSMFEISVKF